MDFVPTYRPEGSFVYRTLQTGCWYPTLCLYGSSSKGQELSPLVFSTKINQGNAQTTLAVSLQAFIPVITSLNLPSIRSFYSKAPFLISLDGLSVVTSVLKQSLC